jgi:hypothetical protein
MAWRAAEAFGKALRVAMIAPRADFRAAGDGVPGRVRPFDCRCVGHRPEPSRHPYPWSRVESLTGTALALTTVHSCT